MTSAPVTDDDFVDERLRVLAFLQHWLQTSRAEAISVQEILALRTRDIDDVDHCFTAALSLNYLLLRHLADRQGEDPQQLLDRLRDGVATGAIPWMSPR